MLLITPHTISKLYSSYTLCNYYLWHLLPRKSQLNLGIWNQDDDDNLK